MSEKRDIRLERAVGLLEWAIRWFFHMFATMGRPDARWKSYRRWRHCLQPMSQDKSYGTGEYFIDPTFPKRIVEGVDWLCDRWLGCSLSDHEKGQLWKMIVLRRARTNFPDKYYIAGKRVTADGLWWINPYQLEPEEEG